MPEPGLTPVEQAPADTIGRVEIGASTVTDVWQQLFAGRGVREAFISAVRDLGADRTLGDVYAELEERDIPYKLRPYLVGVCRGHRADVWSLLTDLVPMLGSARWTTTEQLLATATLFDALGDTPTLAVTITQPFENRRRDQREDVCRLLARLAQAFDVRVVATGRTQRWLAHEHREELPGVREWRNAHRDSTPVAALVEDALGTLDADGTAVTILRTLRDEPAETLPFSALYADPALGARSTVRRQLSRLADLGLVDRFGPDGERFVELREAGREFLSSLDAEIARQGADSECVREPGNSSPQAVLSREHGREGEAGPYRTAYADRATHTAAAAAPQGTVTLVDDQFSTADGDIERTRYVSADATCDEATVAVQASGGLQHVVSSAVAFSSPKLLEPLLTDERLDALDEPPVILRDARCIGSLSDETLASASLLREAFAEWGQRIEEMTTDLRHGEYEDRDRFRSEILRSAHGLAGSVAHLLDALGVDVHRELRVPSGLGDDKHDELAQSVAKTVAIQSRYRSFSAYRQLYEPRDEKRSSAFSATVDAADPTGTFIGSLTVRGTDLHRLEPTLTAALASPAELHEDAPEFAVPVTLRWADRTDLATAVTRTLKRKRLRPTRAAVSLLEAFAGSPYTAARAVNQLGDARARREVQASELRYALSTVDETRLLRDLPPTLGTIVAVLLRTDERLTQRELADRAGVSTRSLRNHRATLAALDLVRRDEAGRWRLTLSFDTERGAEIVPAPTTGGTALAEVVSDVLAAVLSAEEYADPGGSVYAALSFPPDPWALTDSPTLDRWIRVAAALVGATRNQDTVTVTIGPAIEQRSLEDPVCKGVRHSARTKGVSE